MLRSLVGSEMCIRDRLVPNQTELSLLAGTGPIDSVDKAISAAQTLPCASVVVTLGANGAVVIANNDVMHVPAPVVAPIDTTGAGDAFCAAVTAGRLSSTNLKAALPFPVDSAKAAS